MKRLLLDTNVCIDLLRGHKLVTTHFRAHKPAELVLSTITEFELYQGAERAGPDYQVEEGRKVALLLSHLEILPFDSRCAKEAATINAKLLNAGMPISLPDVFIASLALVLKLSLVTNNVRDFSRIQGLQIIDWRKA
ncbi:type II toxin-antitoxin system VapC family toxin [Phragmitibacter flavus]|uniref:Ribonuclease VapC n=1 Tax=Phragmitibacter flavus TaxID=2576071 RepID=A0A5R8KCS6_9BACT|nr:type II toxin-antitoxin system VapC family toxin [Phragmitibacter flavus]TLD70102.1 type II toxin-antitoxin system VapC family toxin [Phragmitibacter flavus]